jgi:Helicase associated domain
MDMVEGVVPLLPQQDRKHLRTWEEQFAELKQYKAKNGNCLVPSNYPEDHSLAIWVRSQRERRQNLPEERLLALESINFDWKPLECVWMQHHQALVSFKKEHGHVLGPFSFEQYGTLTSWVCRQRRRYVRKSLSKDRETLLNEIGFVWNIQTHAQEQEWQSMFQSAIGYKAQAKLMGNKCPSCSPEFEKKVRRWMNAQRVAYARKTLDQDHEIQLKQIGFNFDLQETNAASCLQCEIHKRRTTPSKLDAFGRLDPLIGFIKGTGDEDRIEKCVKSLEQLIQAEFPRWYPTPMTFDPANTSDRLVYLVLQLDKVFDTNDDSELHFLHKCEVLLEEFIETKVKPAPTRSLRWCPRSDVETILPAGQPPEGRIAWDDEGDDNSMDSMATDEAGSLEDTSDIIDTIAEVQSESNEEIKISRKRRT